MNEITLPKNLKGVRIHFVGIKGTGMAALVEIFVHNGAVISGSDVSERFYTDDILEKLNIKALPFSQSNITEDIDYVVYSSAYKLDQNPDLIQAVKMKIPCLLYTQALGSYSSNAFSCGICGVHGKTSTTGLAGTILKELDLPSQVLAGSVINSFGSTCTYTSPLVKENNDDNKNLIFVAETCEYQRHFMSFCPQKIILTSVESDHQDYYPTYESIRDAFVDYACKLPLGGDLIYCADDKGAVETAEIVKEKRSDINFIPYGTKSSGDFALKFEGVKNEENQFSVKYFNNQIFAISIPGKHEVMDALAALVLVTRLLLEYGKNPLDYADKIKAGLINFNGGKRRSEVVGRFTSKSGNSVIVMDDYGHHPTAINTTLQGYREFYKGRKIIVDFMSHTYSRTQALLTEFSKAFSSADLLILHKIYSSARENAIDFSINGRSLYEKVLENEKELDAHYFEEILDAKDFVINEIEKNPGPDYPDGYLLVTMGAGDNWKLGKAVLEEYK